MFLPGGKMPSSPAGKDACRHIFRQLSVSWTTAETGLILQQTDLLGLPTGWSDVPEPVSVNGQTNVVQQTMVTTNRFFRLHRP